MGWPPDKRAKRGCFSSVYLLGSGTCVGGASNDLGGWQGSINYNGEDWPMVLLSYFQVYRVTDSSVIYSKPVSSGTCSLTPPSGKPIKNNVVVAVICNTDFRYNGESSRTNKFDCRLKITGTRTAGVTGTASIASKWCQ